MRIIPKEAKLYPLSHSQLASVYQQDFCLHKNVVQVPVYLITNRGFDLELMKKAVKEEISRNDSLRLFFVKKKGKKMQYFLPHYEDADVETCDFTGKTEEDMFAWLQADASKPVYYLKGETYRIKLFKAPDGKGGIFINVNHASMDISAVLLFFRDLLNVYSAMENHTEMPKPLSSFEKVLQEELRKDDDAGLQNRLKAYFEKLFDKHGPSFYAGVDGMRQLNEVRKRKKDANRRYLNIFDPLNDKAETLKLRIEAEDYDRMMKFCEEKSTSLLNLLYLGIRTWLSKINEYTDDVYVHNLFNRRAKLTEKNCGGCMMDAMPLRTVIPEDSTFEDALEYITTLNNEIIRYSDYSSLKIFNMVDEREHRSVGNNTSSMLMTVFPQFMFEMPKGFEGEIGGLGTGRFSFVVYSLLIPNLIKGGMDCYYEYRTRRFKEEDLRAMHDNMIKVIKVGMEQPDITIGKLLHELL